MKPLEGKYTNWYFNIVNECKANPPESGYTERHHIIPQSIGGGNGESNLVILTAKQHFVCHLLLTKMFEPKTFKYYKMIHAFCMMDWRCSNDSMPRYTSRVHERQRREFSEYMSLKQTGKGNNQFGTHWVYNEELRECKKIPKGDDLPEGWVYGRVFDFDKHFERKVKQEAKERALANLKCRHCKSSIKVKVDSNKKHFCNSKCCNAYQYNHSSMVTLYRGDQIKEVKAQNAPAYKKIGWYTRQDSNLHRSTYGTTA